MAAVPKFPPTKAGKGGDTGTRSYTRYDTREEFLVALQSHTTSGHGGAKSHKTATEMAVDVSKYLYFVNPRVISPLALFDHNAISSYITHLEADGVGPSARKSKLAHLNTAMNFAVLRAGVSRDLQAKAHFTSEAIGQWARALGQAVRKKQIVHMEELADVMVDFKGCKAFIEDQRFVREYRNIEGGKQPKIDPWDLEIWLAARLLHSNHQRPGAIVNMKLSEVKGAVRKTVEGTDYILIRVREHKTGATGCAPITLKGSTIAIFQTYIERIRPEVLSQESDLVFPAKSSPLVMTGLSRKIATVANRWGHDVPIATEGRAMASTAVSKTGSDTDRRLAAKSMSHSLQTAEKYYAATKSTDALLKGFEVLEKATDTSPSPKKRVFFSDEENSAIEDYFSSFIFAEKCPGLPLCREFLKQHTWMVRRPIDIRDRIKNIIKKRKQN